MLIPAPKPPLHGKDYTDTLSATGLVKYARIGGDKNSIVNDANRLLPLKVPSWAFAVCPTGSEFVDYVQRVANVGGLGVIMFHGTGGDYLNVTAEAHRQLVNYLAQHSDIWVAPFQEVMDYVMQQKK